jgi:hypothetical protein
MYSALPVEFDRRERVLVTGEVGGEFLAVGVGEGTKFVKLVLFCSRWVPVRKSLGSVRRFSSIVEAGETERGQSMKDMDTARLGVDREVMGVDVGYGFVMLLAQE